MLINLNKYSNYIISITVYLCLEFVLMSGKQIKWHNSFNILFYLEYLNTLISNAYDSK